MRAAVDTNVLVYAEGVDDPQRRALAIRALDGVGSDRIVIPVQVLGELYNVLTRRGVSRANARSAVQDWTGRGLLAETSSATFDAALDLAATHQLSIWDAVILAAAAEGGCDLLLSEDLHDGFRWRGVTVVNPFAKPMSPLLDAFLAQS